MIYEKEPAPEEGVGKSVADNPVEMVHYPETPFRNQK
jgi:hypothetical protein